MQSKSISVLHLLKTHSLSHEKMSQVCEGCNQWCQEEYWNHLPSSKNYFFKLMLGNFRNELRVPRKFMSNFREDLSETVILRGPSGKQWKTKLVQTKKDFILENGWCNFAWDHNLSDGDFLVFKYSKDSTFDVLIFDPSGCEKELSHFVKPSDNNKRFESCCSIQKHTNDDVESIDSTDSDENKEDIQIKNIKKDPEISSGSDENSLLNCGMYYISRRRPTTMKDRGRAYQLAARHEAKSNRPSSKMFKMKPSHVLRRFIVTIPKRFAAKHLPNKSQFIKLRVPPDETCWKVRFNTWKTQYTLTRGWAEFVLQHNLEVDDYCILELAHGNFSRESVLDVYIFRAVKEIVPLIVART